MPNYITDIKRTIEEKNDNNTLFVLKGFSVEELGLSRVSLADTIADNISRVMSLAMENPKVISFDEFVCLYEIAVRQYKHIIVITNKAMHIEYPIDVLIDDEIAKSLVAHFDDESAVDTEIADIDDYLYIYSNFCKSNDGYVCSYNFEEYDLKNEKIEVVSFGKYVEQQVELSSRHTSYDEIISYPRVNELLEEYWGYTNFRSIKNYDLDALDKGEKKVIDVSQEKIIGDMISQVENCVNHKNARDIFVTAPTGAGKSLMFQLPAMYLAEKYNLVTIVITPLIGLMNDQVQALNDRGYMRARTINSDISPIIKEEILEEVKSGEVSILYLSPESLMGRSGIESLIGTRKIGMIIVDEAHIVTTWGKQFRPDYWYLGDHVSKLRTAQGKAEEDPMSFVIATFTATAIYGGHEDMYKETLNSLHMIDPITYLGYLRRENISIEINEIEAKHNRTEYELDKFDAMVKMIRNSLMRNQKTLIYFPTVALIERFNTYCYKENLSEYVAKYHGQMLADDKNANFQAFLSGEKLIMLATKAFGMGIDIPDIAVVSHYAPTGNVCDYMQEIGRAARDQDIDGHAIYEHMSNDFQHINRLHGLSRLYKGQLVEVMKKILELYEDYRYSDKKNYHTKKRNEMLIDTESFSYIFESPMVNDEEIVNKVKTAMLLIQKDYENRGMTPFRMRPVPIFAYGFLGIEPEVREKLNTRYPSCAVLKNEKLNVCEVNLKKIWQADYEDKMSYPKFKYLLYTGSDELAFNSQYKFSTAMSVDISFEPHYREVYSKILDAVKGAINYSVRNNKFMSEDELAKYISEDAGISIYRAENIVRVTLAAITTYSKSFSWGMNSRLYDARPLKNDRVIYKFNPASRDFIYWIEKGFRTIEEETVERQMYVTNESNSNKTKEILTVLGILEAFGVLRFKSLGGTNSQIYIYVNETKNMRIVRDKPEAYRNKLLEAVGKRHEISVKMLTFLFQNRFRSEEIWDHLENYFLGILPEELK
ncbi:helicase-related protein [Butyrivibrio sp. TB]|uniref:helicase-related protein n=1 Tax=Butyrivibrio sp. TB TaxID=1520809 RepID=UPI0008B59C36|nr:helicase-related protein [Butyrivibrio sp. TB]SEQ69755.1 ATP-dependent DNA helicase RecQ [Butyrivibrio sp. TB]